jgi:hypothetical protein
MLAIGLALGERLKSGGRRMETFGRAGWLGQETGAFGWAVNEAT